MIRYVADTWTAFNSPTGSHLIDIDMVSGTEGWAVGDTLLHYGGGTWTEVAPPTGSRLDAVDMVSPTDGWAGGYDGTLLHYDGSAWTQVASPTPKHIHAIAMISASEGWAVGQQGERGVLLHYDGTSWSTVPLPASASPCDEPLPSAISMASSTVGAAVGGCGTILRYDDVSLVRNVPRTLHLPYLAIDGRD
jgi:photosystem II stability/assembly factor-like uncharacterized protein